MFLCVASLREALSGVICYLFFSALKIMQNLVVYKSDGYITLEKIEIVRASPTCSDYVKDSVLSIGVFWKLRDV